jgi:hypothetical protein
MPTLIGSDLDLLQLPCYLIETEGLCFPAQTYDFSHPCPLAERIGMGDFPHRDLDKGGWPLYFS